MSQDIILKRDLKTETWLIQGEIAFAGSRPEINCVLQYLSGNHNSNATECSEHLFGDNIGRRVVAERLLNIARSYGLVESDRDKYRLTESGIIALQKDQIFIPEDGCWKICVCSEPLLPHQLLSIDAHHEPNAASSGLGKNRTNLSERSQKMVEVPKPIKATRDLPVKPIAGGKEVRVDKIENKGEYVSPQGKTYQIEWNVTAGIVEVKQGKDLIFTHSVEPISRQQALKVLLNNEGLLQQWDQQAEVLAVAFDETTNAERISMKRSVRVKKPLLQEYGDFDEMTLPRISIAALSGLDAGEWAKWRLVNNINMYASDNKYEIWSKEALAPFAEFDFSLPDRAELANELWFENDQQNQHTWHVITAHDWNL